MLRRAFLTAAAGISILIAQQQPYIVHDTKPVITNGPFLLTPAETSVTIVWMTDTPCHSKVVYGKGGSFDAEAEPQVHGLLPVSTRHAVHITGLERGATYNYKAVSTRVVKMKTYWPEKGLSVESPVYSFTTLDRGKPSFSFSLITDTHAELARLNALIERVDWKGTDLLVHLGDAFDTETEDIIWSRWLDPLSKALAHSKPLFYAKGNHESRGAAARVLMDYVPIPEQRFYYARDHGPVHFIVLDTGEDKPDRTNVYAGLNRFKQYKEQEFAWLENHIKTEPRVAGAPFRVLLMHAPDFGWTDGEAERWTELANRAGIDLAVSGHTHRYAHIAPGERKGSYHQLILGPEDLARVDVSQNELKVTVTTKQGAPVSSFAVSRRR